MQNTTCSSELQLHEGPKAALREGKDGEDGAVNGFLYRQTAWQLLMSAIKTQHNVMTRAHVYHCTCTDYNTSGPFKLILRGFSVPRAFAQ